MSQETAFAPDQALAGLRILLVEDEFFIADDLARALSSAGAEIVGPCPTVERAEKEIIEDGINFAVLDLNLHGESGLLIADQLLAEGIPFAFATGYGDASVPDRFRGIPKCEKPFDPDALVRLVARWARERVS